MAVESKLPFPINIEAKSSECKPSCVEQTITVLVQPQGRPDSCSDNVRISGWFHHGMTQEIKALNIRMLDIKQNDRKRRNWITRETLKRRTGRDSEALARAVDALVRHNYIVAENEAGQLLSTPKTRRDNHARVYYPLASRFHPDTQAPRSEHKAGSLSSLLPKVERQSGHESIGKANTTKEKQTNETVTKEKDIKKTVSKVFDKHSVIDAALDLFGDKPSNTANKSIQAALPYGLPQCSDAAQIAVALFRRCALQIKGNEPDLMLSIVDAERLENLVASHRSLDGAPVLKSFFTSDYGYVAYRNHSLRAFLDSCQIFLVHCGGNRHLTERCSA